MVMVMAIIDVRTLVTPDTLDIRLAVPVLATQDDPLDGHKLPQNSM